MERRKDFHSTLGGKDHRLLPSSWVPILRHLVLSHGLVWPFWTWLSLPAGFPRAHSKAAQLTPTWIWFGFQCRRFWSSWTTQSTRSDHRSRRGPCQSGHWAGWNSRWSVWPFFESRRALKSRERVHIKDVSGANLYRSRCEQLRYCLRKHWCLPVSL